MLLILSAVLQSFSSFLKPGSKISMAEEPKPSSELMTGIFTNLHSRDFSASLEKAVCEAFLLFVEWM